MLKNLPKESPHRAISNTDSELIPDPWEVNSPTLKPHSIPNSWKLPTEPHLLIGPTGNPKAISLPARITTSKISPVQVMLQDELKLRASEKLTLQIGDALALLCWMESGNTVIA